MPDTFHGIQVGPIDYRLNISHIIEILMILVALIAGWYRFDSRINTVEDNQKRMTETLLEVQVNLREQTEILQKLNAQMDAFPLHRHAGGEIFYPYGAGDTIQEERQGKKQK